MTFCEEWSLVKKDGLEVSAAPLKCKCWTCSECGPMRTSQLISKAFAGKPTNFITLTCWTDNFPNPEAGARALTEAWKRIVKRAKREAKRDIAKTPYPGGSIPEEDYDRNSKGQVGHQVRLIDEKLPYLAVFEATEQGWPHLHIIARVPWMDQKWLSAQMADLMSSPVCWIKRVGQDGRIVNYITKYVGKGSEKFGTLKRYWTSRNWEQPDADKGTAENMDGIVYTIERQDIDALVADWVLYKFEPYFKRGRWYQGPNQYWVDDDGWPPPSAARDRRQKIDPGQFFPTL